MKLQEHFQEIYVENYRNVLGLCLGYVHGDEDAAKDLAQNVTSACLQEKSFARFLYICYCFFYNHIHPTLLGVFITYQIKNEFDILKNMRTEK